LILKIGAAGEVIRNTPLLHKIISLYADKNAEITWITDFPDFVPRSLVKRVLKYNWKNAQMLLEEEFDLLLSLDKEHNVCALANKIHAKVKKGFLLDTRGRIVPADADAHLKWLTGVFDDLMKANRKHYVEELFEICGWKWTGEKYILEDAITSSLPHLKNDHTPLVGLNTGAGNAWPTRIWPERYWAALIARLLKSGMRVLLLGGPEEHEKNMRLAYETGAYYEGVKPYREFIGLMSYCTVIVTAVTMALHIGIGLEKKIVLLNNIFNRHEFFLYGMGAIVEPDVPCTACYKQAYDSRCQVPDCMELITVDAVYGRIVSSLNTGTTEEPMGSL
jgi:heptosyltransferase-2